MAIKTLFDNEAHLCRVFNENLPAEWIAYNETAGFDILLVRKTDGAQVGIEAKMTLNAKVLLQASSGIYSSLYKGKRAPDFRAALVPHGSASHEMIQIAKMLGITVIQCMGSKETFIENEVRRYGESYRKWAIAAADRQAMFSPSLPEEIHSWMKDWHDFCPAERCPVPDYIPDVSAGRPSPSSLSSWKIAAIKILILMQRRGHVLSSDFDLYGVSKQRWLVMEWIKPMVTEDGKRVRGFYVPGQGNLDLRSLHPKNYQHIEDDFEKWKPQESEIEK